jgi:dihydroflavonol-4-reductase
MKALVLGATGHIGNAIVRELLSRGYEVTAPSRRPQPALNLIDLAVKFVAGDHNDPAQLMEWLEGQDVVVDAAAPYPVHLPQPGHSGPMFAAAASRTRQLLDILRRCGKRFVYVSSFTTLKRWNGRMEDLPPQLAMRIHPYFELKQGIERDVLAAARCGLRAVIVNPTMCLGPWDLHERDLCLIPHLMCGEVPGSVRHILNVIDVRDLAQATVELLKAKEYGRPTLISGHNISVQMLCSWVAEIGGVRPPPLTVPAGLAAFASYGAEWALNLAGFDRSLSSLAPLLIYEHEWLPPCAALRRFNLQALPLYQTLVDSIHWYRKMEYC